MLEVAQVPSPSQPYAWQTFHADTNDRLMGQAALLGEAQDAASSAHFKVGKRNGAGVQTTITGPKGQNYRFTPKTVGQGVKVSPFAAGPSDMEWRKDGDTQNLPLDTPGYEPSA